MGGVGEAGRVWNAMTRRSSGRRGGEGGLVELVLYAQLQRSCSAEKSAGTVIPALSLIYRTGEARTREAQLELGLGVV